MFISIKAISVHDNRNGTFSIELPDVPLSAEDSKAIERLFPNLGEQVFVLLSREALLSSLASPAETAAPAVPNAKKGKRDLPSGLQDDPDRKY